MLTDKERMELLNLRKRVQAQRDEIKRLRDGIWTDEDIIGSEFLTHNGPKRYEIHFRTEDLEKYEAVEDACRKAIGHDKP